MTRTMNVRALELLGRVLVDMRQSPDPQLVLDLAMVRLFAAPIQTETAPNTSQGSTARREPGAKPAEQACACACSTSTRKRATNRDS